MRSYPLVLHSSNQPMYTKCSILSNFSIYHANPLGHRFPTTIIWNSCLYSVGPSWTENRRASFGTAIWTSSWTSGGRSSSGSPSSSRSSASAVTSPGIWPHSHGVDLLNKLNSQRGNAMEGITRYSGCILPTPGTFFSCLETRPSGNNDNCL